MLAVTEFLLQRHTEETAKIYERDIKVYLNYQGEEKAKQATYQQVMQYLEYLRKKYKNPRTINRMLYGVKAWYEWLVQTGQREDHPCKHLTLKDAKYPDIQLQDLFTSSELEKLLERKERYYIMQLRNQVAMSLLIYQALRLSELINLTVKDIDLEEGTITVKGMAKSQPRTLKMKPKQVMLFYQYIHEVRAKTVKEETEQLLLNIRGKAAGGDEINYLVETFKPLYPERNLNAKTIRQSVITNLLKEGKDLRVVQVFAGHKNPGSTEKYRQTGLEELTAAIRKHHPLG